MDPTPLSQTSESRRSCSQLSQAFFSFCLSRSLIGSLYKKKNCSLAFIGIINFNNYDDDDGDDDDDVDDNDNDDDDDDHKSLSQYTISR